MVKASDIFDSYQWEKVKANHTFYKCKNCKKMFLSKEILSEEGLCPFCADIKRDIENRRKNTKAYLARIGVGKRYLDCSLENFQGGKQYVDFCKEWLKTPIDSVFFTGRYGCGKTHLAVALCRELIRKEKKYEILFSHAIDMLYTIRKNLEDLDSYINKYSSADFLVIDDLGAERTTDWVIETFSLIIDRRDREMLPTIITSNLSLVDIEEKLSGRISSRIANGKIVKINLPDYRKKRR